MGVAWLIYLISLWITFKEPSHEPVENENHANNHQPNDEVKDALEQGLKQPLLITLNDKGDEEADQDYDDSEEASEESRLPATSIRSAYRLLTPSVKVQLLIYFMLKYVMEILVSESSVITTYYFNWSTSRVALFLACLGLTVLPVNVVVGSYISNMFEDRQILWVSEIMICIGVLLIFHLIIPYSVPQYMFGPPVVCFGRSA